MLTNIDIDETLVGAAMQLTGEPTKRAVVDRALRELIRIERLRALRGARGTLKWQGNLAVMRERAEVSFGTPAQTTRKKTRGSARRHKRPD